MINQLLWGYYYAVLMLILFMSIYGIAVRPNLLKKIIMLSILSDTANILAVMIGLHVGRTIPPVYPGITFTAETLPNSTSLKEFAKQAVDPLPQVLVVTAIVIGLAVLVFLSFTAILLYRKYGTLDTRDIINRIRGETQ